jgi:hypothetical protein
MTVAVRGLGAMGLPMARRPAEQDAVIAFDVDADRRALAAAEGLEVGRGRLRVRDHGPGGAHARAGSDVPVR